MASLCQLRDCTIQRYVLILQVQLYQQYMCINVIVARSTFKCLGYILYKAPFVPNLFLQSVFVSLYFTFSFS